MRKLTVALFLALSLLGCGHPATPKLEGMCSHMAIMGGEPFPLPEGAKLEGSNLVLEKDGHQMIFTGAVCILRR